MDSLSFFWWCCCLRVFKETEKEKERERSHFSAVSRQWGSHKQASYKFHNSQYFLSHCIPATTQFYLLSPPHIAAGDYCFQFLCWFHSFCFNLTFVYCTFFTIFPYNNVIRCLMQFFQIPKFVVLSQRFHFSFNHIFSFVFLFSFSLSHTRI